MARLQYDIHFSRVERVYSGPGQISALAVEVEARGFKRALVATNRSLAGTSLLEIVEGTLGDAYAGTFDGCAEHAGIAGVRGLAVALKATEANVVVAFGGSSVSDTAKAARASLLASRDPAELLDANFQTPATIQARGAFVEQISVTTTLSAGEYSWGAGVTDEDGVKRAIISPLFAPAVIINDAELTELTPGSLWLTTGVRALDHGLEAVYSAYATHFTDALAAGSLELLVRNLKASVSEDPTVRLAARSRCQEGAFLSAYAGRNARYGLSHAIGHKSGPAFGISHGVNSCITQPHAMRFIASLAPERFGPIARAFGLQEQVPAKGRAEACADFVSDLIQNLGVTARFRDFQVSRSNLGQLVGPIHQEMLDSGAFGFPVSQSEVAAVVDACW